jgi:hypothetical protein
MHPNRNAIAFGGLVGLTLFFVLLIVLPDNALLSAQKIVG